MDTISTLTFDNIYHEHVNFWSVTSLNTFFNNLGFFINRVERIDTHGGSIRVYVQSVASPDSTLDDFLDNEKEIGVDTIGFYKDFSAKIESIKQNVRTNLDLLKQKHSLIGRIRSPCKSYDCS